MRFISNTADNIAVYDRIRSAFHIKKELLIQCLSLINTDNREFIEETITLNNEKFRIVLKRINEGYVLVTAFKK